MALFYSDSSFCDNADKYRYSSVSTNMLMLDILQIFDCENAMSWL